MVRRNRPTKSATQLVSLSIGPAALLIGNNLIVRRARWTFDIMVSVEKNEWDEKVWARQAAELEEQWKLRAVAQRDESLRQHNLMYGGLIAIGIVMMQPFLTEAPDLSATICVVAFSVAIPILAALVLVNSQERYRRREAASRFVQFARQAAFGAGFIGVAAGFWHITPIAGVGILVAAVVAIAVQSVGYTVVEQEGAQAAPEGKDQGAPE